MVLHIIRDPSQPLAKQILASGRPSLVAALLPPSQVIPQTPTGIIYAVTEKEPDAVQNQISYAKLFDLIFEAEKVIVV